MYENTFKRTDIFWFDKFTWHWVELLMYLTCNNAQLLYTIHYTLQGPLSCFLTLTWWLLSKVSLILLKEILFCLLEMETKTEHLNIYIHLSLDHLRPMQMSKLLQYTWKLFFFCYRNNVFNFLRFVIKKNAQNSFEIKHCVRSTGLYFRITKAMGIDNAADRLKGFGKSDNSCQL